MQSKPCDAETEQWFCIACKESRAAQAEENGPSAPSALLTATTRVLYLAVRNGDGLGGQLITEPLQNAMSAFSNSLLNQLWLCAALGALSFDMGMGSLSNRIGLLTVGRYKTMST